MEDRVSGFRERESRHDNSGKIWGVGGGGSGVDLLQQRTVTSKCVVI